MAAAGSAAMARSGFSDDEVSALPMAEEAVDAESAEPTVLPTLGLRVTPQVDLAEAVVRTREVKDLESQVGVHVQRQRRRAVLLDPGSGRWREGARCEGLWG